MQIWIRIAAVAAAMALAGSRSAGAEASGLGPYLSPAQLSAEMKNLEADYPGRAEVLALGRSAGGRPLEGLRISRGDDQTRAEALVAGNIHGDEPIGNRTAMAVARFLLEADGRDPLATQVLDRTDVYVIPLLNPDGDAATYDSQGRAPVQERRPNGRRVDLNRNFPRPGFGVWLPLGYSGSHNPKSTRYNGPQPLSEPETRAVRDLAAAHHFFADVDFHCAEGMIIPAKCKSQGCYRSHQAMAQAYQAGQSDRYSIFNRPPWMPIYQGNMEDFLLDEFGALSLLIELGSKKERPGKEKEEFWKMNPRDPAPILENNVRATLSAILKAYEITEGRPVGSGRR